MRIAASLVLSAMLVVNLAACSLSPRQPRIDAPNESAADLGGGVVPDITGLSYVHAAELLLFLGVGYEAFDVSAAQRDITHPVQWVVLNQSTPPGTMVGPGSSVKLDLGLRGETLDGLGGLSPEQVRDQGGYSLAPDLLGMKVEDAKRNLASLDLELAFRDADGARLRDREVPGDWWVVGQEDLPGARIGNTVGVEVAQRQDASRQADHPHSWDGVTKYLGAVTGFSTEDPNDHKAAEVLVDRSPLKLAFIEPFDRVCEIEVDKSAAIWDRNAVLPEGTMVLAAALTAGYWNEGGFVHPVEQLNPDNWARDSTNEQLVRLGSWIPEIPGVFANEFDFSTAGEPSYFLNTYAFEALPPVARDHLALIVDAGNSAAGLQAGPLGECVAFAIEQAQLEAEAEAERKALMDAWNAEYRRKLESGYFQSNCRDGDGDGVCYER